MDATGDLIELALREDIGPGDITTDNLVAVDALGKGVIVAKQELIVAGMAVAERVFCELSPQIAFEALVEDGRRVHPGSVVARIEGCLRALLIGERTALNFLQRLSGIATQTRAYVDAVAGSGVTLVDTRKTAPGWRALEKYAVRVGGARNHRMGLFDGVLIKDNHIAVAGGIAGAIETIRRRVSHLIKVEVEAATLQQVEAALAAGADVIMLDNMDVDQVRQAVAVIAKRALVEVSGGVTRSGLAELARSGVDLISIGALTHSAVAVDLSMRIEPS
jgi:nicotinate-nucleotide pyrophosphorylase (carboxylating)